MANLIEKMQAALNHGGNTHRLEDVFHLISTGKLAYFGSENSIVLCEIQHYPRKKVGHLFLAAGCLAEIIALQPAMEAWAAANGCDEVTAGGRPGWQHILAKRGYEHKWSMLGKALPQREIK